ncbi:MAG: alpha-mannosidase [Parabacteroides sp.]|nr:alpha-mannosidase [Parabacteroides sp.]
MKRSIYTLLLLVTATRLFAQQAWFVDGFHGGIYGHYPVEWKTEYLTDLIAGYPEWRMCLEIEPETWDTVAVRTPGDYARFRSIATDKRVEFTNPAYTQPYCYNISGESIIRQFGYGIERLRKHFPGVTFATYSVEEPCFTSCLPQILRQFGFRYAVLKCPNTCWGGYTAPYGGESVNWTGPDGSSILTVPRYACEELVKNSVWQTAAWGNETSYLKACAEAGIKHPVGMTFQDAGWKRGPWIGTGDSIKNNSVYVTWREYFETVADSSACLPYRLSQEDIRVSLMWGSQALQRIARQVRHAENRLIQAEKISMIAYLCNGYRYGKEQSDEAWRTLMLSQHHDSWIVPYNRLRKDTTWAEAIAGWTQSTERLCNDIITGAVQSFSTGETGEKGFYLRIYNTLGVPRREIVRAVLPESLAGRRLHVTDAAGKKTETVTETRDNETAVLLEADIPAFGYATYRVEPDCKVAKEKKAKEKKAHGPVVLENSMYRIVIDPLKGGTVKSLVAKQEGGKEFTDSGNEFSIGELRGFFYDEGAFRSSAETPAEVTVIRNNPLEKTVRIQGSIASHPFTQLLTIKEGQRKIEFDLTINWKHNTGIGEYRQQDAYANNRRAFYDDRFKLNVLFPVDLESPRLYKNAPFDVCRSELDNTHFNTWDSIKHTVILNWVDLAEGNGRPGFALLSDHTTSYSYGKDFPLGLTVQFSGNGLWGRDYPINGPTHIRFAVIPHSGEWDTADIHNESQRWNEPPVCSFLRNTQPGNVSLINTEGTGYELSATYLQGDEMMVRFFNASGDGSVRTIKFGTALSKAEEIELGGAIVATPALHTTGYGSELKTGMPRFGLKTFKLSK